MKKVENSYLFLCVILINIIAIFNAPVVSQNLKDSTSFYYKAITEIKDAKATTKAFDFFENKTEKALQKNDTIKAAYYTELISLGQFKMGFFFESESNTIRALSFLDHIKNNPKTLAARQRLTNQLGMIYRNIADFDNALRFYNEALKLNEAIVGKMAIVLNIANLYADNEDYEKAVSILKEYYDEAFTIKKVSVKGHYFDNYGYYLTKNGDLNGLKDMQTALSIRKDYQDLTGLFSSYRHLSNFYSDQGNRSEALHYASLAEAMSDSINRPTYQLEALGLKLNLENHSGLKNYIAINNRINKTKQLRENKYAAIKYNIAEKERIINKKELELKGVELDSEKQKRFKLTYMLLGCFILLISIGIYFNLRVRHKKEKLQQVYITEARISKKVHDEVANDVYHLMTKLQSNKTGDDEVIIDELEDIYHKTRDISKENNALDIGDNYDELIQDMLMGYRSEQVNVITKNLSKIEWGNLPEINKITLYRVLQELMTNMRKHSKANIVVIGFNQAKNKTHIEYKDNGVGCVLNLKGGLQNTENRMESINGTIIFETSIDKGFKAIITI